MTLLLSESSLDELDLLRLAHAGASRRAVKAFRHLKEMQDCTVRIHRAQSIQHMAQALFHNAGYDACERYADVESCAEAVADDLDAHWSERSVHEGEEHYVLRPFFCADPAHLHLLGLGYLRGCAPSELHALSKPPVEASAAAPTGLTPEELEALRAFHYRETVQRLSALRHLNTALQYVRRALEDGVPKFRQHAGLILDPCTTLRFQALLKLSDMPLRLPPASFFGSDMDKVTAIHWMPPIRNLAFLWMD